MIREVVTDLIEEYKAAEKADYVTWGGSIHNSTSATTHPLSPTEASKQDTRVKGTMRGSSEDI